MKELQIQNINIVVISKRLLKNTIFTYFLKNLLKFGDKKSF